MRHGQDGEVFFKKAIAGQGLDRRLAGPSRPDNNGPLATKTMLDGPLLLLIRGEWTKLASDPPRAIANRLQVQHLGRVASRGLFKMPLQVRFQHLALALQ